MSLLQPALLSFLCFLLLQERVPDPPGLVAVHCVNPPALDGVIGDDEWRSAQWSAQFVDITGDTALRPSFETRAAFLWDSTGLYVAARLEEPDVWGTLTERDAVVYHDNDFEFFFDPDGDRHRYGEIEMNALNTVWDLLLERPYRNGGPARTDWNIEGLVTAVSVQGTINDPSDTDEGWTLEMYIPWESLRGLSQNEVRPVIGSQWRVNFSRVQWPTTEENGNYRKTSKDPMNWVWAAQGVVDMHRPDRWGVLEFQGAGAWTGPSPVDPNQQVRALLMRAFEAFETFRRTEGRSPRSIEELSEAQTIEIDGLVKFSPTADSVVFSVDVDEEYGGGSYAVTREGRLVRTGGGR